MLILCGSWLGKKGFYEAEIEEVNFYSSLHEIKEVMPISFAIFSYDLSGEILGLKLKKSDLPSVILIKIKKFRKIKKIKKSYSLYLVNKALKDEEFLTGILKVRKLIEEGTVYQINLTKYKTLYQMHSTVEGKTERSLMEIIKATFPPASVTGAPKRKAVEIIDTVELHNREYYCGCAGLIKNKTDFTLSVLIRTAIGFKNNLSYYAGCGIVWDSVPKKELKELYLKVRAFYKLNNFEITDRQYKNFYS